MGSKQNIIENFSAFLTYFNLLIVALIMINIVTNAWTEDSPDQDLVTRNIFLPAQSTSVFMKEGVNTWAFISDSVLP